MQTPHFRFAVVGRFLLCHYVISSLKNMLESLLIGVFAVALVCWAMGAYNRLVRLRAAMTQTFTVWRQLPQSGLGLAETQNPEEIAIQRQKTEAEQILCKEAYEAAVTNYNLAITQIPAAWLAKLFGFKAALLKAEYGDEGKH